VRSQLGVEIMPMTLGAQRKTTRYIVISPVRNELQYLGQTIRSMVNQTIRPVQWVLVDDGSSDGTAEVIAYWASKHTWILPIHRPDRDRRVQGPGSHKNEFAGEARPNRGKRACEAKEIEAFLDGYMRITVLDWEFLVKIDGDIGFERDYFEKCFNKFDTDRKLGIGGGVICHQVKGRLKVEPSPRFHVRGATKIYRRTCWEQIGGVIRGTGWDTIDEVKANMLGWSTCSFPDLKVVHYRHTGAANGAWRNAVKNGMWSYISGYHPIFMLVRCVKSLLRMPILVASVGLLWGFLLGYIRNIPQIDDRKLIQYLRQQQLRRLFLQRTIWK